MSELFDAWARQDGKPRWGDKTPHYVREIPTLLQLFPDAKVIHIYRDGRDVALSWLRSKLLPRNLFTAATLWRSWVQAGRRAGAALSADSYLEVRYEQLVAAPDRTMQSICAFVHEPFCHEVLTMNALPRGPRIDALTVSKTHIVSTNVEKWKTQLSEDDRRLFASVAGDLLDELGYPSPDRARPILPMERMMWRSHQTLMSAASRAALAWDPRHVRTAWEFFRAGEHR